MLNLLIKDNKSKPPGKSPVSYLAKIARLAVISLAQRILLRVTQSCGVSRLTNIHLGFHHGRPNLWAIESITGRLLKVSQQSKFGQQQRSPLSCRRLQQ